MRRFSTVILLIGVSLIIAGRALSGESGQPTARASVEKSLTLLARIGTPFIESRGCISCHHNVLPAMAISLASKRGFKTDEQATRKHLQARVETLAIFRERCLQGQGPPGDATTASYALIGLAADKHPPDKLTDAMAHYLMGRQNGDGRWTPVAYRPPMEYSDITTTSLSALALQMYAPPGWQGEMNQRMTRARDWLAGASPRSIEERALQLLGLRWTGASGKEIASPVKALLDEQRADGGWAQIPSLESDAYATGQALVALYEGGGMETNHPAYRRGINHLLKTQLQDGSWHVRSRSIPFQKYFESGFPHGHDQWISAAATSWATMALIQSLNAPPARGAKILAAFPRPR